MLSGQTWCSPHKKLREELISSGAGGNACSTLLALPFTFSYNPFNAIS